MVHVLPLSEDGGFQSQMVRDARRKKNAVTLFRSLQLPASENMEMWPQTEKGFTNRCVCSERPSITSDLEPLTLNWRPQLYLYLPVCC